MKKLTKFIVSLFIVSISLLNITSVSAASSVTLVGKTTDAYYANYNYGTDNLMWANKFVLKDSNGVSRVGECITPAKDQPSAGTYTNISEISDKTLIKILYFSSQTGYGEDLAQKVYTKSHGKSDKQGEIILTHVAAAKRYAEIAHLDRDIWARGANQTLINDAQSLINEVSSKELPVGIKGYIVNPGNDKQLFAYIVSTSGKLRLVKKSSKTTNKSLSGAIYNVYSDSALKNKIGSFTTDKDGNTNAIIVNPGKYYVREEKAPAGFELDTTVYAVNVETGKEAVYSVKDNPIEKGKVKLKKTSSDKKSYDMSGAVYTVYKDKDLKDKVGDLTTDKNGDSNTLELDAGTYYVKETKAPKGFAIDPNVSSFTLKNGETKVINKTDSLLKGKLYLIKTSSEETTLSLAGAIYYVYTDSNLTNKIGELTTDETGTTNTLEVDAGTYYVKEITAPNGFDLDNEVKTVVVSPNETAKVTSVDRLLPQSPQTGIMDYLLPTLIISTLSGSGLYLLYKKKNKLMAI